MNFNLENEIKLLPRVFHFDNYLGVIKVECDSLTNEIYWHGYVTHLFLDNNEIVKFFGDISFCCDKLEDLEFEIICSIQEYEEAIYDSLI